MRQDLIGYLLDSVDEEERAEIESARQSPETASEIEHDLAMLERALKPLERDRDFISPPTVGMPIQFPYPPMPDTTPFNKFLVLGCLGSPKCIEFNKAIGRAPIVKTSLKIPPTPVAAP